MISPSTEVLQNSNPDGTGPREPPDTRSRPDSQDNLGLALPDILQYGVLIASLRITIKLIVPFGSLYRTIEMNRVFCTSPLNSNTGQTKAKCEVSLGNTPRDSDNQRISSTFAGLGFSLTRSSNCPPSLYVSGSLTGGNGG